MHAIGKLPVEVDMDWVPQTTEPAEIESPPPIPPKMNEIASSQDGTKMGPSQSGVLKLIEQGNDSAPVLPPKPKYVIYSTVLASSPDSAREKWSGVIYEHAPWATERHNYTRGIQSDHSFIEFIVGSCDY